MDRIYGLALIVPGYEKWTGFHDGIGGSGSPARPLKTIKTPADVLRVYVYVVEVYSQSLSANAKLAGADSDRRRGNP